MQTIFDKATMNQENNPKRQTNLSSPALKEADQHDVELNVIFNGLMRSGREADEVAQEFASSSFDTIRQRYTSFIEEAKKA